MPGVQANLTVDEWHEAGDALLSHPQVVAALRRRGVTETDAVLFDVWAYGDFLMPEAHRGRRLAWSDTWVKSPGGANPYANHLRGFHCVVDLNTMELLEIEEGESSEWPRVMAEYLPRHIPKRVLDTTARTPLQRLEIIQPDGPSFIITGNLARE